MSKFLALSLLPCTLFILSFSPGLSASEKGEALLERMLQRLGGRTAWANLENTINGSMQYRAQGPFEVYSLITMDFTQPRFRIHTTATEVNLVRVINGEQSWRISWDGKVDDLPSERYTEDHKWYAAHLYRTIHRLASNDPKLSVKANGENRLDVYSEGPRLRWFKLTDTAEPYAFGSWDDEKGSICGPWNVIKNGIRHPAWVSNHDGTWRASVRSLEVNVPLHDSQFERPQEQEN